MQVHFLAQKQLPAFNKAVVTIGSFDGVHLGHRLIIDQLKKEAALIGGETVIISFYPHPRSVIAKNPENVKLLCTLEEKISLLEATEIDHLVIVPFNLDFAHQSAESYISNFLYHNFHPHTVIIGYDHRFGNNRVGDYHLMDAFGKQLGFKVKEIPEHILNEVVISSTKIRHAITDNAIEIANQFLGYPYFFEGTVIKGNQLGRTLGFPTANISVLYPNKLIPGNGVYAVTARIKNSKTSFDSSHLQKKEHQSKDSVLKGMMNIGVRPTVDGINRVIEVNLFDFNEDIYNQTLQVYVHHYIRGEIKFSGLDALKEQLAKDKISVIEKAVKIGFEFKNGEL